MLQSTTSTVSPTGSTSASSGSGSLSNAASSKLGKNDFLKLLVTQLRNQNPRSPMEGREFATQMAQFSSVEQLTNISDQIQQQQGSSRALMQSINSGVATDLIGRTVEANGNEFQLEGDSTQTLGMNLSAPASEVQVTIRDAAGNPVHTRTLENVDAGSTEVTWDGTTNDGSRLPDGTYTFDVEATDSQGESVSTNTYIQGPVDRISFEKGGTRLWVDGTEISMGRVRSVAAS